MLFVAVVFSVSSVGILSGTSHNQQLYSQRQLYSQQQLYDQRQLYSERQYGQQHTADQPHFGQAPNVTKVQVNNYKSIYLML